MKATALFLLAASLVCPAAAIEADADVSSIQKVVQLLRDMSAQVTKEGEADKTAYDKYACWCETGKKQKTEAVSIAENRIAELEAFIEEAAGLEAKLKTEIAGLEQDIADGKASLATAQALREKENAEFLAEEEDMKETITALTEAIAILSKVQLLQKKGESTKPLLLQLAHIVKDVKPRLTQFRSVMQQDFWDVMSSMGGDQAGSQSGFLPKLSALSQSSKLLPWEKTEEQVGQEAKPNELEGAAASAKSYNARSSSIYGILQQMKDEFSDNLSKATKAENDAQAAFEKMKETKIAEIKAAEAASFAKQQELSDTEKKRVEAKGDLESTKDALSADQQMLLGLEKNCKEADEDYAARSKVRGEELVALQETIAILTEDDTRDLFGKTLSFLQINFAGKGKQISSEKNAQRNALRSKAVERAMKSIMRAARKNQDWMLATLAVKVRLDDFTKVKEMMDKMMNELKEQQKAESEKLDFCKKQIDEAEDNIKVESNRKQDLEDRQKELENTISTLEADIESLNTAVSDMSVSLKQAGEDRKAENQLYQTSVADQRATIVILKKASDRLAKFYAKKSFSQAGAQGKQEPDTEPGAALATPPPKPADYEKHGSAGGVMQMLAKIISQAEAEEKELVLAENHAQEDYAAFAAQTTASIEANRAAILEKTKLSEEAAGDKAETEGSLVSTNEMISKLQDSLKGMHLDCDFLLKYYQVRQKARSEEIASIVEAKAILSGADFGTAMEEADDAEE